MFLVICKNKYQALSDYLNNLPMSKQEIQLTFSDIEGIIGSKLPPSAYDHRGWWANLTDYDRFSYTRTWMSNGFEAKIIDRSEDAGTISFERISSHSPNHRFTLNLKKSIDLWQLGKETWNLWVQNNPHANINFTTFTYGTKNIDFSFSGFNFPSGKIDFSYLEVESSFVDFSNANFHNSQIVFDSAKLGEGISFKGVDFGNSLISFKNAQIGNNGLNLDNINDLQNHSNFKNVTFQNRKLQSYLISAKGLLIFLN